MVDFLFLPEPDELDRFFFRIALFEAIEKEIGFRGGGGGGDVYKFRLKKNASTHISYEGHM